MLKPKINVGSYYEFTLNTERKIAFAVMYGFSDGKNKNVYALMMYTREKIFEFPIQEQLFIQWVNQGRIKEITYDEALAYVV